MMVDSWNIVAGEDRWWVELVDWATMSQGHGSLADHSTLIKAQFSVLATTAERGRQMRRKSRISVSTTRLEAADCDGMCMICISVTFNLW